MMPGKIPERWEEYTPLGEQIKGTRFVSLKVPLSKELCSSLPPNLHFTPSMLLEMVESKEKNLGLLIDLTNTKRYYNPQEVKSAGINYAKIFTEGRVVPSSKVVSRFFKEVDRFLQANEENNHLVGVHCTHGLNRTGYLVCRYMIDKLKFSPDDAIKAFNTARGYDIERENYLDDLHNGKKHTGDTSEEEEQNDDKQWRKKYDRNRSGSKFYDRQHSQPYSSEFRNQRRDFPNHRDHSNGYHHSHTGNNAPSSYQNGNYGNQYSSRYDRNQYDSSYRNQYGSSYDRNQYGSSYDRNQYGSNYDRNQYGSSHDRNQYDSSYGRNQYGSSYDRNQYGWGQNTPQTQTFGHQGYWDSRGSRGGDSRSLAHSGYSGSRRDQDNEYSQGYGSRRDSQSNDHYT